MSTENDSQMTGARNSPLMSHPDCSPMVTGASSCPVGVGTVNSPLVASAGGSSPLVAGVEGILSNDDYDHMLSAMDLQYLERALEGDDVWDFIEVMYQ